MSIFDMFKGQQQAGNPTGQAATQTQPSNGQAADPNKTLSDPNPSKDSTGKMPGTDQTPGNPLDAYAQMFQNAQKAQDAATQVPEFKLDPKVLDDVSGKMNFLQGIDKELMTKAQGGDVSALLQVIQTSNQNAYKAALQHSSALTDTYINQRSTFDGERINNGVRQQLTQSNLASAPNYNHPVIKAELNRVAAQMAKANPDMPPQEIAASAQKYINDLASALSPKQDTADNSKTPGSADFDWAGYIMKGN